MPMSDRRKRRVPKLCFTANRGIGWHVTFRDPVTGHPKKHRFDLVDAGDKAEAERRYAKWLSDHLYGRPTQRPGGRCSPPEINRGIAAGTVAATRPGCLLEVASGLLNYEQSRVRDDSSPRARGTIHPEVFRYRRHYVRKFLEFINEQYGQGAVGEIRVCDLIMKDIEDYNRQLANKGLSSAAITHAMQGVRQLIIRAGRPEHGQQTLSWNWESRDRYAGKPKQPRSLPTLDQLRRLLSATDLRGRTMIWTAIGLGFGPSDLAALRIGHIDSIGYDLRRGKTGVQRYGDTPPLVWAYIERYVQEIGGVRAHLVFRSESGLPLVSGRVNRVQGWWHHLRERIGESKHTISGFYVLRHVGATEFGSRIGCSISEMRGWLGHSASSAVADIYMRPVAPEHRELIEWIRERLVSSNTVC